MDNQADVVQYRASVGKPEAAPERNGEYAEAVPAGVLMNGAAADLQQPVARERACLGAQVIRQCVEQRWPMTAQDSVHILNELRGMLDSTSRDSIRALELLRAMAKDNVEAAALLDKTERLDAGTSTENVSLSVALGAALEREKRMRRLHRERAQGQARDGLVPPNA